MIALIDSTNTIVRITEATEGYDLSGLTSQALPEGFDPLGPSHLWDGTDWQVNLDVLKAAKRRAIRARRDVAEWSGCATPLGRVDSDGDSQRKINGAVMMASIVGPTFSIDWTMESNAVIAHDQAAMTAMGIAVGQHVAACHAVSVALNAALAAATSAEEIDAIDIEGADWP